MARPLVALALWVSISALAVFASSETCAPGACAPATGGAATLNRPGVPPKRLSSRSAPPSSPKSPLFGPAPGATPPPPPYQEPAIFTFNPPALEYEKQPLSIPATRMGTLSNTGHEPVMIKTIYSTSTFFHPSMVNDTAMLPGSSLTFTVVSLPRELMKPTSGELRVLSVPIVDGEPLPWSPTGVRTTVYELRAEAATANPYGMNPVTDIQLLVGQVYTPDLHLGNPYKTKLHISEIFTSEKFLHLSLPSAGGQQVGRTDLWHVEPHTRKHIVSLNFTGGAPGTYIGYVHIKTNCTRLHERATEASPAACARPGRAAARRPPGRPARSVLSRAGHPHPRQGTCWSCRSR